MEGVVTGALGLAAGGSVVGRDAVGADAGGAGGGSSRSMASMRSSGVGDHRQAKSWSKSLVKPPVRTRVQTPQASRMVAAMVSRRVRSGRRRVATAQATKARPRTGSARTGNRKPIAPVRIDLSTRWYVAKSATTIRARAPRRSDQGARLKKSHHRMMRRRAREPDHHPD